MHRIYGKRLWLTFGEINLFEPLGISCERLFKANSFWPWYLLRACIDILKSDVRLRSQIIKVDRMTHLNIVAELEEGGISRIEGVGLPQPRSILQRTDYSTLVLAFQWRYRDITLQSHRTPNHPDRTYPSVFGSAFHFQLHKRCRCSRPRG